LKEDIKAEILHVTDKMLSGSGWLSPLTP